jgi:hypothetical protein
MSLICPKKDEGNQVGGRKCPKYETIKPHPKLKNRRYCKTRKTSSLPNPQRKLKASGIETSGNLLAEKRPKRMVQNLNRLRTGPKTRMPQQGPFPPNLLGNTQNQPIRKKGSKTGP